MRPGKRVAKQYVKKRKKFFYDKKRRDREGYGRTDERDTGKRVVCGDDARSAREAISAGAVPAPVSD